MMNKISNWKVGTRFWIISENGEKLGPHILDGVEENIIKFHPQDHPLARGEISRQAQLRRLPGPYPRHLCSN